MRLPKLHLIDDNFQAALDQLEQRNPAAKSKLFEKLSPLENGIITILWQCERMYVRDIYNKLKGKRKVALTSIAVNLDRLYKKGIVGRKVEASRGGFRYLYFPAKNQKEYEKDVIDGVVNKLIDRFGRTAVSYFNERFSK